MTRSGGISAQDSRMNYEIVPLILEVAIIGNET